MTRIPTATVKPSGKIVVAGDSLTLTRFLTDTAIRAATTAPQTFSLETPHPNPFREQTTLRFTLQQPIHIRLFTNNVQGLEVACLQDGGLSSGEHTRTLVAKSLPAGICLLRLATDASVRTQVVTRVK